MILPDYEVENPYTGIRIGRKLESTITLRALWTPSIWIGLSKIAMKLIEKSISGAFVVKLAKWHRKV